MAARTVLRLFCQESGLNYDSGWHLLLPSTRGCRGQSAQNEFMRVSAQIQNDSLLADFVPNLDDMDRAMQILYPSV